MFLLLRCSKLASSCPNGPTVQLNVMTRRLNARVPKPNIGVTTEPPSETNHPVRLPELQSHYGEGLLRVHTKRFHTRNKRANSTNVKKEGKEENCDKSTTNHMWKLNQQKEVRFVSIRRSEHDGMIDNDWNNIESIWSTSQSYAIQLRIL